MIFKTKVFRLIMAYLSLMLFWLLGYGLSHLIALPATLLGIILLFCALFILRQVPASLLQASQFALRHLSLFFIPPLYAAWLYKDQLEGRLGLFLFLIIVSTALSFWLTALIGKRLFQPTGSVTNKDDQCP